MGINSNKRSKYTGNWNPGHSGVISTSNKRAFSKLKDIYGTELINAHKQKLSSKPLTKEEKNKIKNKIANDLKNQRIKNIFILSFSIILFFLILYLISYIFNN